MKQRCIKIKAIIPAVEPQAEFPGLFQNSAKPPVASSEYSLQEAGLGAVIADGQPPGVNVSLQGTLFFPKRFHGVLAKPLEGSERLGDKGSGAESHLHALSPGFLLVLVKGVHHLLPQLVNGDNVLDGFRRQANHKVELDAGLIRKGTASDG